MIVNEIITIIIAIVISYLLGSIPSAYIAVRLIKGKDIRQMGGGNVGARNAFQQAGKGAGVAVGIFDVGKGAAAVAIAQWLLNVPLGAIGAITIAQYPLGAPETFVLLAGVATIAGHIWSIYLKFTGGNGLATTIGVLAVLMPWELLITLAITLILIVFTRNPVLSVNIGLMSVPLSTWLLEKSWLLVTFSIIVLLILVLHFLPTATTAITKAGSKQNLVNELLRRDKHKRGER
jgi:glycerol-3-phosphate acyltransferase PlsY